MTVALEYTGILDGKMVTITHPDLARHLDRTSDFVRRHKQVAKDKGLDIVAYVQNKSESCRRNVLRADIRGKRPSANNAKRTYKEDKFVSDNKGLFDLFLRPIGIDTRELMEG